MADRTYRVREFAALAGVTVRALHHYDRLGLLKPRRTQTGYRAYTDSDLEILEQIVALKFIGVPLNRIKKLLRRDRADIVAALRAQHALLEEKKRLLERAIAAVREAEQALRAGHAVDGGLFRHIIEVIEMQTKTDEWNQRYDTLVQAKIERLKAMSPDTMAKLKEQWTMLFTDIEGALDQDPASPAVQQLAERWMKLLGAFVPEGTPANPELLKQFGAAYSPAGEWPAGARQPEGLMGDRRIWDLMAKALAARA